MMEVPFTRLNCEFLRSQAKQKFDYIRRTWIELGSWAAPHRIKWMLSQVDGERNNRHIVDPTHIIALRSYVAGFLEGNTSATRPWYRIGTGDPDLNKSSATKHWLDLFTRRTLNVLTRSNFYNSAGQFYYDYGTFNTGAYYIDELPQGIFFHNLTPGAYYVLNNGLGEAVILVREFQLTVKALVDTYGKKVKGEHVWDNISNWVRTAYEQGNYTLLVDVCHIIKENEHYDREKPAIMLNKRWLSWTYECGANGGSTYQPLEGNFAAGLRDPKEADKFLKVSASRRKPFIIGRAESSNNFEYGEKGPTLDSLGLIKSLNKKAIAKDQALEQMLKPALQGPASLRKNYITSQSNSFIPLDATSAKPGGGLRPVFEVNPAIQFVIADVNDMRNQVQKLYYADYLLYLSQNPKTRTATETDAVVKEQQLVIGPNLQSLNWTHNVPILDFLMDYVLYEDPWVKQNPPPQELTGQFLRPSFISVFQQAQNAADLPSIERYMQMVTNVGQLQPSIWAKANLDILCDLYEDRLYLPSGLNREQGQVDAQRQQDQAMAQQHQMMTQQLPAMAGAAKDMASAQQSQPQQQPQQA